MTRERISELYIVDPSQSTIANVLVTIAAVGA